MKNITITINNGIATIEGYNAEIIKEMKRPYRRNDTSYNPDTKTWTWVIGSDEYHLLSWMENSGATIINNDTAAKEIETATEAVEHSVDGVEITVAVVNPKTDIAKYTATIGKLTISTLGVRYLDGILSGAEIAEAARSALDKYWGLRNVFYATHDDAVLVAGGKFCEELQNLIYIATNGSHGAKKSA